MRFSKMKVNKIIDIVFILYFIISILLNVYNVLNEEGMLQIFNSITNISNIMFLGGAIIFSCIEILFGNIPVIAMYIGGKLVFKKYYKQKLDSNDFKKYEGYYRDLLNEYNVSTLAYIDNFNLDYESVLTAHLLELENKKILKINDNNITIIGNPINEVDKLFVESISDNKLMVDRTKYQNIVINDAINNGLLETQKNNKGKYLKLFFKMFLSNMVFSFLFMFIIGLFGNQLFNNIIFIIILFIVLSIYIVLSIAFPYLIVTYIITSYIIGNPYIRTKEGKIINEKLEGLKNYLRDFGDFENKTSQDLILWEEYLIYSVVFGQNEKIKNEYSKFLMDTLKK